MDDRQKIINVLRDKLQPLDYVHALWLEGSIPQGHADEYSDVDVWIGVDDDKVFKIFSKVEEALSSLGQIDFAYKAKYEGQLGQNVYHIAGMSEYLAIDVNTQALSRIGYLTRGIDEAKILFDKKNIVKFKNRQSSNKDIEAKREKLHGFYKQMRPNVLKNYHRGKFLEALGYYRLILDYTIKFLRNKNNWSEKEDFGLKHVYRDLTKKDINKLEYFYSVSPNQIVDKMEELENWIWSL